MTEISGGNLSKTFVIVGTTAPSSPFEGQLWRDTSTDVLKQWDGSSWVSVQTSPDGITIIENSNGQLEVNKNQTIFADFENGNMGDWSITGPAFNEVVTGATGAESTSNYVRIRDNTSESYMVRQIDMSDFETLVVFKQTDSTGDTTDEIYIDVDGAREYSEEPTSTTGWEEIQIDVSGISSTVEVRLGIKCNSGTYIEAFWDRVRTQERIIKTESDGGGGI